MRPIGLALIASGLLAGPAASIAQQSPAASKWYSIVTADGAVIGYASHETDGLQSTDVQEISFADEGGPATTVGSRIVRSRDEAGAVRGITVETQTDGVAARATVRIEDGRALIVREGAAGRREESVSLPAGARLDGGEALLRGWDPKAAPRLEYQAFDAGALQVERVVVEPAPGAAAGSALRLHYDGEALRGVERLTLSPDGEVLSVSQPLFGTSITFRPVDRATALKAHRPFKVVSDTMTPSPFTIPSSAAHGHIRFVFGFRDGLVFPLPQTGEQKAAAGSDTATLDICSACGPGLASDPAALADALKPTAWLQSDDKRIIAMAAPIGARRMSGADKMESLISLTKQALPNVDYIGHFSASEALDRRSGDCTETAVVLAALGRAAGIPTKVASGLVYLPRAYHGVGNAFAAHSWVLAYVDGAWRSYDAALGVFDSTHIVLTVGDGDARSIAAAGQLASLLRWDGMTEVRTRPAG